MMANLLVLSIKININWEDNSYLCEFLNVYFFLNPFVQNDILH